MPYVWLCMEYLATFTAEVIHMLVNQLVNIPYMDFF